MKITINITQKDLELFENDTLCMPLCNKHKMNPSSKFCPDCNKVKEEWRYSAGKIFWKCWRAFWSKHNKKGVKK